MGLTVHYQGCLEHSVGFDFEVELVRLPTALGARAHVPMPSSSDDRKVRGAIVLLGEQVEPASLLVSTDGWLLPVIEIEATGDAPRTEPPWISVKTQYGPIEAHVALINLLTEV